MAFPAVAVLLMLFHKSFIRLIKNLSKRPAQLLSLTPPSWQVMSTELRTWFFR
jgi:hypothetical protein